MISIKMILVPTNLSAISVPAIGYAGFLAKDHDAEMVLLHVVPAEARKEHFTGGYPEGVGFPMGNEPAVRRQPDLESIYETKKQVLLGFLDQKIAADFRKTTRFVTSSGCIRSLRARLCPRAARREAAGGWR